MAVAYKWLNETAEVVGDIEHHHVGQGDSICRGCTLVTKLFCNQFSMYRTE